MSSRNRIRVAMVFGSCTVSNKRCSIRINCVRRTIYVLIAARQYERHRISIGHDFPRLLSSTFYLNKGANKIVTGTFVQSSCEIFVMLRT